ncbi:uncharacterized protein K460DRAFT_178095 [Cucurbitaria berberidis CBS 394.84]|uniref:Uncharacterized protein n=1 Tax=Cucurbitaria berberidis CBS 394.84 TaxID=1168544 RepID=A0A9P4L5J5_9PLEO|nr:uncharacterized protein K460DRAFT_178095 [Cucurbitaria berberidis CBS 394.84]KAF1842048.1 hypothetical protein K460DRAFT_178095 [Cucurbitaria berberidis CBS 394.84]
MGMNAGKSASVYVSCATLTSLGEVWRGKCGRRPEDIGKISSTVRRYAGLGHPHRCASRGLWFEQWMTLKCAPIGTMALYSPAASQPETPHPPNSVLSKPAFDWRVTPLSSSSFQHVVACSPPQAIQNFSPSRPTKTNPWTENSEHTQDEATRG